MSLNQMNKQYVRDNIPQNQQSEFFDYFLQIPDHHLFDQWQIEKTIEVVEAFKQTKQPKPSQSPPVSQEKALQQEQFSSCKLSAKVNYQQHIGPQQRVRSSSVKGKKESAMDFLKEIQASFMKTPNKNSKTQNSWNRVEDNIWLNFNPTQVNSYNKKTKLVEQDPFENFDSCIVKSSSKKQLNIAKEPQQKTHVPELKAKLELKRSFDVKSTITADLRKSRSQLRQKRSSNSDKLFKQKLNEEVPCKKLRQQTSGLKISVTGHEMVHRTLLPDYAIYHVLVSPSNTICKRAYDNFLEFRNVMEKLYPGVKVPTLDSGSWFSESDIALINKNKVCLELFLNDVVSHPLLSNTAIVKEFFSLSSPKSIEKALSDYEKIPDVNNLAELVNQKGRIKVTLSEETNKVVQHLPKWKKYFEKYLQNYEDLVSTLSSQLQSVKLTYDQLAKLSSDFNAKLRKLLSIRTVIDLESFQKLLLKQTNHFDRQRSDLEKHLVDLKENYSSFLKYQKLNVNSFEPLIEKVHTLTEKYLKRLEIEPESPCSEVDPSKIGRTKNFSTDIWHEDQNMTLFKYQLGYLTAQLLTEEQIFNQKMACNMNCMWQKVFERSGCRV